MCGFRHRRHPRHAHQELPARPRTSSLPYGRPGGGGKGTGHPLGSYGRRGRRCARQVVRRRYGAAGVHDGDGRRAPGPPDPGLPVAAPAPAAGRPARGPRNLAQGLGGCRLRAPAGAGDAGPRARPQRRRQPGQPAGDVPAVAGPVRTGAAGAGARPPLGDGADRDGAPGGRVAQPVRRSAQRQERLRRRSDGGHAQRQRREPGPVRHRPRGGRRGRGRAGAGGAEGLRGARLPGRALRHVRLPRGGRHGRPVVQVPAQRRQVGGHPAGLAAGDARHRGRATSTGSRCTSRTCRRCG